MTATGAKTANLVYDPLGRLWQTSGGSAGTTRFFYDGDRLIQEYDGIGAPLRSYAHGTGVDEPLVWYELTGGTSRRFLHANHQGSIVALAGETGNLVAINSYDEYGIPAPTNLGRFAYSGQTWIAELGMYYYKARIYSPTLGRFMQTDPIGYEGGNNLYAYVGNDPVNGIDPTGLCDPTKDPECISDPSTASRAPDLPTIETPEDTDAIVITALRRRREQASNNDDVKRNDELPIVVVGGAARELTRDTDYKVQELICTAGNDSYNVTETRIDKDSYTGAEAAGHLHRGSRDPGPGPDDGHSVASRRVVQYMAWGKGKGFGVGKVEFHDGAGFTYKGLEGPQPSEGDVQSVLAGMNRGAGKGTGGMTCKNK